MSAVALTASPSSALAVTAAIALTTGASLAFGPSSALAVTAALALSSSTELSISPASRLNAPVGLTVVDSAALSASPSSSLAGQVSLTLQAGHSLQAEPSASLAVVLGLAVSENVNLSASPLSLLEGSVSLTGIATGMTLRGLVDELLGMWGIFSRCSAPDFAIERAINDINASLQLVWNNADERDYWSRSSVTISLGIGESSQNLADDIQNVIGPCRLESDRRPLAALENIGDLETFSDIYLDGETSDAPVAYHIERLNQSGADPAKCVFHVTPAAAIATDFLLEVVKEAPRFTVSDIVDDPIVPIPHRYVETLLLPVARHRASSYYLFRKNDQKETIENEYLQAQISLGLADPQKSATDSKQEVTK